MKNVEFYDIYNYIYVPFWKTKVFLISVAVLVVLTLTVVAYFLYKRFKAKKLPPPLTPKEWAIKELEKLHPGQYKTKQEFKKFYFALTRIYKEFLHRQFSWDVKEKTDKELLVFLRAKSVDVEILEKILKGSLLVKFANAQALKEQAQVDLKNLISILKTF